MCLPKLPGKTTHNVSGGLTNPNSIRICSPSDWILGWKMDLFNQTPLSTTIWPGKTPLKLRLPESGKIHVLKSYFNIGI